jgi:hypothetical protein
MKKVAVLFPSRHLPLDTQIKIKSAKPLGITAPFAIKHEALELPLYDEPIKCALKGFDKKGKKIEINKIGRWLFGVPGYGGQSRIVADGNDILIYFPKKSPKAVYELLDSLKEKVESKN